MLELIDCAVKLYNSPNRNLYIKLAKQTISILKEDTIQKTMKKIADAELNAAYNIAIFISEEKNPHYTIQRILVHLESAYYIYANYYNSISDGMFSYFKKTNAETVVKQICLLISAYHKALGDNPAVIKQWLIDSVCPCEDYMIVESLLGTEFANEYQKQLDEKYAHIHDDYDDPFYHDPFL